ncbi:hypothetical protein FRC03_010262 [Tulasnella sp. 419]|nr:hypothetical protein FRC03_010262 [Tulasnella sp. 419]
MEEVTKSSSFSYYSSEVEERLGSVTHSAHKRVDIDHQLRADLLQNCSRTSVEGFLDAFKIEGLEETREWRRFKNHLVIKQDNLIRAYLERYKYVRNEQQYYAIFAAIANRITQLFNEHCGGYVRRRIRFLDLGNQVVKGSLTYHCGEEVLGTGSALKPDGMVILLDDNQASLVDEAENSIDIRINLEKSAGGMEVGAELMMEEWDKRARMVNKALTEGVQWKDCLLSVEFKKRSSASSTTSSSKHSVNKPFTAPQAARPPGHTSLKRVRDDDDEEGPKKTSKRARNPPSKTRVRKQHMQTADSVLQGNSVASRTAVPKELKSSEIQLAGYALETLCALGNKAHTFGILLQDLSTTLWFYDRSGAIASAKFDFHTDIVNLAKFIIAFSAMDDNRLGFIQVLQAPGSAKGCKETLAPQDLLGFSVTCGDQKATFDKLLDRRFSLVGRGTLVHRGTVNKSKRKVAVKLSWQVCSRKPEWEIIQEALDGGCPKRYIVDVIAHSVHCKLSEGFRGAIQGWSGTEMYEDRELRIIITELLSPVTNMSGLPEIKLFVWSTFHAIYYLDKAGIHHRDVSAGNLGYQQLDCGRRLIKFFDFDHARKHDQKQSSRHFTGTLPFLAIDLLLHNNAPYLVRFDYESMLWTSLWIAVCYENGKDQFGANDHPLFDWFNPQFSMKQIANSKIAFLHRFSLPTIETVEEAFEPLVYSFADGYRKEKPGRVDETLCGHVKPKALRDILLEGQWGECDRCLLPTCEQCSQVEDNHLLVII